MGFHDPEVDRVLAAADENRGRLAASLRTWGPTPNRAAVENPACPCWSGFHDQHGGICGCPTCEPEEGQP